MLHTYLSRLCVPHGFPRSTHHPSRHAQRPAALPTRDSRWGDAQDAAHHGDGETGPVLAHELEPFGGITSVPERTRPRLLRGSRAPT